MIDLLNRGPASLCDSQPSTPIDDRSVSSFFGGHGVDDGLSLYQFLPIEIEASRGLCHLGKSWNHPKDRFQRPHLPNLLDLIPKIHQRKRILPDLTLQFLRLLGIEGDLGFLDQGEDIPHSKDSRGHPIRIESFQGIQFFAHADEFDGPLGHCFDRECRSSSRIPIHFSQNHSINTQSLIEILGDSDSVLAGHGIGHQEHLFRLKVVFDLAEFQHQGLINMKPSRRINEHQIVTSLKGYLSSLHTDLQRCLGSFGTVRVDFQFLTQLLQLIDGRWTVDVRGDKVGPFLSFLKISREFRRSGRLPTSMETNQHDRHRRASREMDLLLFASHEVGHLFSYNLDQLLGGSKASQHLLADGSLFHRLDEVFDNLKIDIRFQEGHPHLF